MNNVWLMLLKGKAHLKAFLAYNVEELLNASGAEDGALAEVDAMVKEYGAGTMNIGRTLFVYIVGVAVLAVAILMVLHGRNRNKIAEVKDGAGWQIAGALLGFGAVGFVVFMQTIGTSLFG